MFKKKYTWAIFYSILLTLFTIYVGLDTFVISRVYLAVPSKQNTTQTESIQEKPNTNDSVMPKQTDTFDENSTTQGTAVTEDSYNDGKISITLTKYREYETSIYVADITLTSFDYLQTAFAQNAYGRNVTEKTSVIAQQNDAILAINGDYYGAQQTGYVIRNGTLYQNTVSEDQEDLVIYADGSFGIISEGKITAEELIQDGVVHLLSFGPSLITDGVISVSQNEEVGKAKASNPRTAIGILDNLHYVFVVSDGRTDESRGLSLYQLADFMQKLGVKTAYNLDGGGSSTMYFNGAVINNPTSSGRSIKERSVSDIVYIGY